MPEYGVCSAQNSRSPVAEQRNEMIYLGGILPHIAPSPVGKGHKTVRELGSDGIMGDHMIPGWVGITLWDLDSEACWRESVAVDKSRFAKPG